eukprot:scaffold7714_cov390-Prasinococcus_capsulatus_cf.AAC.6
MRHDKAPKGPQATPERGLWRGICGHLGKGGCYRAEYVSDRIGWRAARRPILNPIAIHPPVPACRLARAPSSAICPIGGCAPKPGPHSQPRPGAWCPVVAGAVTVNEGPGVQFRFSPRRTPASPFSGADGPATATTRRLSPTLSSRSPFRRGVRNSGPALPGARGCGFAPQREPAGKGAGRSRKCALLGPIRPFVGLVRPFFTLFPPFWLRSRRPPLGARNWAPRRRGRVGGAFPHAAARGAARRGAAVAIGVPTPRRWLRRRTMTTTRREPRPLLRRRRPFAEGRGPPGST